VPGGNASHGNLRFGVFEVDARARELRKNGSRVRLQQQPFELLMVLLERPSEVVSREELRQRLWPADVYVDFDRSLNKAMVKLREALGDSSDSPLYVETLPRVGYRFIGPVTGMPSPASQTAVDASPIDGPDLRQPSGLPETGSERVKVRKRGAAAGLVIALGILAAAGYGIYFLWNARHSVPFASFTITQVTSDGKTVAAAVSPDGKYLLSVQDDHGEQSLWLRHLQTNSDTQVIATAAAFYQSPAFSPDGSYFYFRKANDTARTSYTLLRAPVLGGAPQFVMRDVDSAISFSPGGARMVYLRANDPEAAKFQVLTANSDGTDEKFVYGGPIATYPQFVAWSPDGKKFAALPPGPGDAISAVQFQDVASGKMGELVPFARMFLNDLTWLPSGGDLLVTYQKSPEPFGHAQIGVLSGFAAQLRPVTNDTNSYKTLTLSADGKTLATVQQKATRTLYLLPDTGFSGTAPNPARAQHRDALFFSWAANGDLYFNDGSELLRTTADGNSKTKVLSDPDATVLSANSCPDGRHVLVDWAGHGGSNQVNIWRVDADGSNAKQLSHGARDVDPICSRDGKWAYYKDFVSFQLTRVPIDGGAPEVVPGSVVPKQTFAEADIAISSDGKRLVFLVGGPEQPFTKLAIVTLDAGANATAQSIDEDPRLSGAAAFTPDGKALVYPIRENGVDNLWLQPLDGSRGRQITNFQSDQIQNFEFSPDGSTLGVFQQHVESDVVLLHDLGTASR